MPDKEVFQNIDYANKVVPTPLPDRINDIDTHGTLYDNIITASDNNILDLNAISSFTAVSQRRDDLYNMIDIMCEDPIIAMALDIYTADCCETNDKGQVVWAEGDDENVLGMVQHLLDQMNVDKNAYQWVNSFIKYGDLYLRLLRESEFNDDLFDDLQENKPKKLNEDLEGESSESEPLTEAVILKAYKEDDHFAEYLDMHKNPAEVFELQKFGKTIGYIRSHILTKANTDDVTMNGYNSFYNSYVFNKSDVDLFPADSYVHACLEDTSSRVTEEVSITNQDNNGKGELTYSYKVRRGQSILYNTFRTWRELSLLENSVLLNRITKSAIVRVVQVETPDMDKDQVRALLQRIKSMVEQKSALNVGKSYEDYTNPGPMENTIYVPTHDGTGAVSVSVIGGDVETDNLNDVNYFKNKLFASLGIPGAYLGESESDGSLFNNGTSLSLKSSKYAKTIKRIQNCFCQAITDAVNLMLLDKGLRNYINKFTIHMQAPTTQEEKDRRENLASTINNVRDIMGLIEDKIEDKATLLEVLKSLLSGAITDTQVLAAIQTEIDRLEAENAGAEDMDMTGEGDMGDMDFGDMDLGGEGGDMGDMDFGGGDMDLPTPEEAGSVPMEVPEEGFESGEGDLLNEENNLPSFYDLGINYTDVH